MLSARAISFSLFSATAALAVGCAGTSTDGGNETEDSGESGAGETGSTDESGDTGESGETGGGVDEDLVFSLTEPEDGPTGINDVVVGWEDSQFVAGYVPDPAADRAERGKIKMYYDETPAWEDFLEGTGPCFQVCSSALGITSELTAGDVVAVGRIRQPAAMGGSNAWMRRYTWMGDVQWTEEWTNANEPEGEDQYNDAAFDPNSGDILVVGSTEEGGLWDAMIARYDGMGNEVWRVTHNGPAVASLDIFSGVVVGNDGTAYAIGREEADAAAGGTGILVAAYDTAGTQSWTDRVDGMDEGFDAGGRIALSPDGSELAAVGRIDMAGAAQQDLWAAVYDLTGTRTWEVQIDNPDHTGNCTASCEYGASVAYRSDGSIAVAGGISASTDDRSAYVAVLDGANGDVLWERWVDGEGEYDGAELAAGVAVDTSDDVIAGGWLLGESFEEWWFAKWSPMIGG
jgi:hypothetical protein